MAKENKAKEEADESLDVLPDHSERALRVERVYKLRAMGVEPYAYIYNRTHKAAEIQSEFSKLNGKKVKTAGRITAIRTHGGMSFIDIIDDIGKVQVVFVRNDLNERQNKIFDLLTRGDYIGVEGEVFKTKAGEVSIKVKNFEVLSLSLRNLPTSWSGIKDPELKYRQRYVDMAINPKVREIFIKRAKIVSAMREFLDKDGFVEIETPTLQTIYGGALARPFETFHNALKRNLYLRIADELYLKRLIVGGFERVYEICKDFRNEGIDTKHNPEFTQMEFYCAYIDYHELMNIGEQMVAYIAKKVLGTTKIVYKGHKIDLTPPWRRLRLVDALKEYAKIDAENMSKEDLVRVAEEHGLEPAENVSRGELIQALFEELVEDKIIQPTFIYDYPTETSPLAKSKRGDPSVVERFEIFIGGDEFGNAYSELNDPIDQRERFEGQQVKRAGGDLEAHPIDKDYCRALEYGMPPTGGFGIGIDRLAMLLLNIETIKDVIAFPQLREEEKEVQLFGDLVKDTVFKKRLDGLQKKKE